VYGSNQNIALVFDGNGLLKNRYLFANGIDQIEADEKVSTGTTLWALTDHLGSVRDVVDNSGVNQNHIVYDAFGNITSQSNSSVVFRNTYTGQEFDPESGLFNYGSRPYDPYNGKFIQEDKIGFAAGDANLFRYVGNNSINFTDPSGNSPSNQIFRELLEQRRLNPDKRRLNPDTCYFPTFPKSDAANFSGLPPWMPRNDSNKERQRLEAINIVKSNSKYICQEAKRYNITPDAIAGAILWEALENPYDPCDIRTGIPGKIHPYQRHPLEMGKPTEIEKVEQEGRVLWEFGPGPVYGQFHRLPFLQDPRNAITGIAAILDRSASIYEALPITRAARDGINIRNQAGVLGALYQGGNPEGRSQGFLERRIVDRKDVDGVRPRIPTRKDDKEALGEWVSKYRSWISNSFFGDCKKC